MCRWSGQLGPKKTKGDRQVPEGFYAIYPSQMNPHSNYYLSFNVGYPNLYDRVHGYSGNSIMVHGICSSAGCFSMTNREIGEIYTIAREAFAAGQPEIQMQSMPFHMTADNIAKYRLDPNIDFWRELKNGADNFEVTKHEVAVGVCNTHYVFNAKPANGESFDPSAPAPCCNATRWCMTKSSPGKRATTRASPNLSAPAWRRFTPSMPMAARTRPSRAPRSMT